MCQNVALCGNGLRKFQGLLYLPMANLTLYFTMMTFLLFPQYFVPFPRETLTWKN